MVKHCWQNVTDRKVFDNTAVSVMSFAHLSWLSDCYSTLLRQKIRRYVILCELTIMLLQPLCLKLTSHQMRDNLECLKQV